MKLHKKIDLYYQGNYLCSTNKAKTCTEAKAKYLDTLEKIAKETNLHNEILNNPDELTAHFDKDEDK